MGHGDEPDVNATMQLGDAQAGLCRFKEIQRKEKYVVKELGWLLLRRGPDVDVEQSR